MIVHKNITISGNVQGVGFRYSARIIARQHSISGYVKNLTEGSVFIEAEGNPDQMEEFIKWCHKGPMTAEVDYVKVETGEIKNFESFEVRIY